MTWKHQTVWFVGLILLWGENGMNNSCSPAKTRIFKQNLFNSFKIIKINKALPTDLLLFRLSLLDLSTSYSCHLTTPACIKHFEDTHTHTPSLCLTVSLCLHSRSHLGAGVSCAVCCVRMLSQLTAQ